jgi:diketogulonate reductase-like aldo/keto reductase
MDHSIQPLWGEGATGIFPLRKENSPQPLKDPRIKELADIYGKTSAQIILRYLVSLKEFCTLRSEGFYKTKKVTSVYSLI